MQIAIPAYPQAWQPAGGRKTLPCYARILCVTALAVWGLAVGVQAAAQAPATPAVSTPAQKPAHRHKHTSTTHPTAAVNQPKPAAEALPAAPKAPDWPVNDHPTEATVVWNSQGLRIDASNSSLEQILKDVATATGAKVEGLGSDERIFGTYGPGSARDVLSQLLDGSGYNVLMLGGQGTGTPSEVILSAQTKGNGTPAAANPAPADEENADVENQPQPGPVPNVRNGFTPGEPPRNPQQFMPPRPMQMQNNPQ